MDKNAYPSIAEMADPAQQVHRVPESFTSFFRHLVKTDHRVAGQKGCLNCSDQDRGPYHLPWVELYSWTISTEVSG